MTNSFTFPGVYVQETSAPGPIAGVPTSTVLFIGETESSFVAAGENGSYAKPQAVTSWTEYVTAFASLPSAPSKDLSKAMRGFFLNGGSRAWILKTKDSSADTIEQALTASEAIPDEISIVCAPGLVDLQTQNNLLAHCEKLRTRFAILDEPAPTDPAPASGTTSRTVSSFGATYTPRLLVGSDVVRASGYVAGIYANTDSTRGVKKAPANVGVLGAIGVETDMSDSDQGLLNQKNINVIRNLVGTGVTVWGARTLDTSAGTQFTYVNVRRLMIYIEQSLKRGLSWVVFEPNDTSLWKRVERVVTVFLTDIWRDGGLFGATADEAFIVNVNSENNPPETVASGELVIDIGVSPVRPAEFVLVRITVSDQSWAVS